jgi:4-amino-4-deoxy-L-arabinose transferase
VSLRGRCCASGAGRFFPFLQKVERALCVGFFRAFSGGVGRVGRIMFAHHPPPERKLLWTALVMLVLAYGLFLFWRGFFDPDEGRYAQIPQEMLTRGDWSQMRMMDFRYYEKPILSYWLTAPALAVFGPHDWAARVPLLFPLLGTLLLAWRLTRRYWPRPLVGPVLMVSFSLTGIFVGTGFLTTDAFLVFWFTAVCVALFGAYAAEATAVARRNGLLVAAVCGVMGFMTKGAVAIVLPGAALFLWLLWERRLAKLWTWWLIPAALLFVAILAPWLWWLEQHNPGFFKYFVIDEHLSRFTGTRTIQGHPEPWWFFLALLPVMLLPWTLFGVRAIARAWGRHDSLTRFLVCWAAVVLVFFSVSSGKLMSYILPAFPALGLLLGRWGAGEPSDGTARDRQLWGLGLAGLWGVAASLVLVWLVSWFQLMPGRVPQIWWPSVALFAPLVLTCWLARRALPTFVGAWLASSGLLLALALLCSPLAGPNFNVFMHSNNSRLYKQLAARLGPEDQLVVCYDYRPALVFYMQRPYIPFQAQNELEFGMRAEPWRRGSVETISALRELARQGRGRMFALVDPPDLKEKIKPLDRHLAPTDFPQTPDTIVFEIKFKE